MGTVKFKLMKRSVAAVVLAGVALLLPGCAKTIQKKVNILQSITAKWDMDRPYWSAACQAISIPNSKLQELLASDVKVITSSKWNERISYQDEDGDKYPATCNGTSYILEGSEKELLNLN